MKDIPISCGEDYKEWLKWRNRLCTCGEVKPAREPNCKECQKVIDTYAHPSEAEWSIR